VFMLASLGAACAPISESNSILAQLFVNRHQLKPAHNFGDVATGQATRTELITGRSGSQILLISGGSQPAWGIAAEKARKIRQRSIARQAASIAVAAR